MYFLGVLSREDGHPDEARVFFLRLVEQYSESIWANQAALELASSALAQQDWETAIRYAQAARGDQKVRTATKHAADLILAQAREGQGEVIAAYEQYQEVRQAAPHSRAGKVAKERVERLRALDFDRFGLHSEQDYLAEMQLCAKEGDGAGLEALVTQFNGKFPGNSQQAETLTLLATAYKQQRRNEEAIRTWRELADRYPDTSVGSTALFHAATLLWNNNQDDEALAIFERLTGKPHVPPRRMMPGMLSAASIKSGKTTRGQWRRLSVWQRSFPGRSSHEKAAGGRRGWRTVAKISPLQKPGSPP